MSTTNLVRPSRDGDQFHYLWAARRCLNLLSADSNLVAVSIEGPSPVEQADGETLDAGEELIDIAEYFGSEDIAKASLVRYMQLKHSTLHANDQWTASGLEKTIRGFAKRFVELQKSYTLNELTEKLEFWFVTNRPISLNFVEAFADAAAGVTEPRHPVELGKLKKFTGLTGNDLEIFCNLLHFEGSQDGYWDQRNILFQELSGYLPDSDTDAPTQLKELVTRRALSEGEKNPTISKIDVLRALNTDESRLFPASSLIGVSDDVVPREQENEIIQRIRVARVPVIIHASGGVGKSVLATRIGEGLPEGSVSILYDCFGNGQYRNAAGYRHRHKDALVQIANELAAKSLCHPLIPTAHADTTAYVRAFVHRLAQASKILRSNTPDALLCVVVDAADNAQMAAEEVGDTRSFVLDLIRISIPEGVRLVFLCRSHRQELLEPPLESISIELRPFCRSETAAFLLNVFPNATENDIDEFQSLSSQNPRVQALALSQDLSLSEILRLLGPNPTTVEDTISNLLDKAIAKLKDTSSSMEKHCVGKICAGMAVLRPLIPIPILSAMSGVNEDAIKSFALDIGRPLLVSGETVQFLDEPAETWFREKFKPTAEDMAGFITSLKPLANRSVYVASLLPQLMLEAGQFSELVGLALSSDALPEGNALERRDVELQRLQFALKAGLRSRRYVDAAKLAMKAGGQMAGDDRQRELLQENTDLVSEFLQLELIQEVVSRRTFGAGWTGSHYAYEASLLSGRKELVGEARSRLRMAEEWLNNWSRLTAQERENEVISDQDIVELTLAHLNIHGPINAAESLSRWSPKEVSYRVGRLVIRRLIDHGRWSDIDGIAHAAAKNFCLELAIVVELRAVHKTVPYRIIRRLLRLISRVRLDFENQGYFNRGEELFEVVTAVIESALKNHLCTHVEGAAILGRYLPNEPPTDLVSRFPNVRYSQLRAYSLHAALEGRQIDLIDVAHSELKNEIEQRGQHQSSRMLFEFQSIIGSLLPWHKLWISVLLGQIDQEIISSEIDKTRDLSIKALRCLYGEAPHVSNEIALLWMDVLHQAGTITEAALESFTRWKSQLERPLFTPTLNKLCKLCAQCDGTKAYALDFATESYTITKSERSDAESKAGEFLEIARAVLTTSTADAHAYFDEAMEVAGKIGDENLARWDSILDLADSASRIERPVPTVAYQFARCAELTYSYVVRDKHFPWMSTVTALCGLCPSSGMTILSRWRDRQFGWQQKLLPIAIGYVIEQNLLDPRDALPMIGFKAQWDYDRLLDAVLVKSVSVEEKVSLSQMLYRYVQFSDLTSSTLKSVQQVAAKHDIELENLTGAIASCERQESIRNKETNRYNVAHVIPDNGNPFPWDEIFSNKNVATAYGLSQAYLAFERTDSPRNRYNFFAEVIRRVPIGSEPDFIEALTNFPELDLYTFKNFLEQVPENWKTRPAITHALADVVMVLCRRYCMDVRKNRFYEAFPFELACSMSGLSQEQIIDVVLDATGEFSGLIESNRLFSLVGLLTTKLNQDDALDVLTYGLGLFDSVLEDSDGDGPWVEGIVPPSDIRDAVAGYVWSALAAPEAVCRWEATHTVRELCRLRRGEIVDRLVKLASTGNGGPFIDRKLPFYSLHALQWMLIGLARATLDIPASVAPYGSQLVDWALRGQPHVLIRAFAARSALRLIESGYLDDVDELSVRLKSVTESQFPTVDLKTYPNNLSRKRFGDEEAEEDKFYFGIDYGPYWYEPLGRVFGLSQREIEREALQVIRKDFGFFGRGYWEEDERSRRGLYEERHTSHSHGSYPRADSLDFYHAYHAMMIVAGRLLATRPVHVHPDYDEYEKFADWLSRHDLTRNDGRWLWDRRDPEPIERGAWLDRDKDHPDRRKVTEPDFDDVLGAPDKLNLWGQWTESDEYRQQSTHIYSALVKPDTSEALMRAVASTRNVYDYAIPTADSIMEIDKGKFELKGWVLDYKGDARLDEYDRWAAGISFPPPCPAPFIVERMQIATDLDHRFWRDQSGTCVIESQVWGCYDEDKRNVTSNPNRGSRIKASASFITAMLGELNRDLIIEVQIERSRLYRPYISGEKDDDERIKTTAKIYLLRKDGSIRTI